MDYGPPNTTIFSPLLLQTQTGGIKGIGYVIRGDHEHFRRFFGDIRLDKAQLARGLLGPSVVSKKKQALRDGIGENSGRRSIDVGYSSQHWLYNEEMKKVYLLLLVKRRLRRCIPKIMRKSNVRSAWSLIGFRRVWRI
jgi:hypothetical protein